MNEVALRFQIAGGAHDARSAVTADGIRPVPTERSRGGDAAFAGRKRQRCSAAGDTGFRREAGTGNGTSSSLQNVLYAMTVGRDPPIPW